MLVSLIVSKGYGQISDNFSSSTISPVWIGQTSNFTISGKHLRSNGSTIAGQNIYIAASISGINSTEWQFWVGFGFAPSSTNYAKIYLSANISNLASNTLSGYYIQLGETNLDRIHLYKQTGGVITHLFSSTGFCFTSTSANFSNVRIKVIRDNNGLWSIYSDCLGGFEFNLDGTVFDNSITSESYFGIECVYGTASRYNLFNFDDIYVGPIINDNISPTISGINALYSYILEVVFSEPVRSASSIDLNNYSYNNGTIKPILAERNSLFPNKVTLTFSEDFIALQSNTLVINSIADYNSNVISNNSSFDFTYTPIFRNIVFNEIMADPSPTVGLPEVEYLELYNRTNQAVQLQSYTLVDGTTNRVFNYPVELAANGYLVICNSIVTRDLILAQFPSINICTLAGLSVSNAADQFELKSPGQIVIDKVSYTDKWYKNPVKSEGGWSFEQINYDSHCLGSSNWRASEDPTGGTPGAINSANNLIAETTAPQFAGTSFISSSEFKIGFTEQMDSVSLKEATYLISNGISIGSFMPVRPGYDSIRIQLNAPLALGKIYALSGANLKDCSGNLLVSNTLIGIGRKPEANEVIINEIMADENPAIGLPEAEFIELFNLTPDLIDLSGLALYDGTSSTTIPPKTTISPGGYLLLTSTSDYSKLAFYGKAVGVTSFPSLNNAGESIGLKNIKGETITEVKFSDKWYRDDLKNEGGWTLERINPFKNCGTVSNWKASSNLNGGTPGTVNAVFNSGPDAGNPALSSVFMSGNMQVKVAFSEAIDPLGFFNSEFKIKSSNEIFIYKLISENSDTLQIDFANTLDTGKIYNLTIQNLADCSGNILKLANNVFGIGKMPDVQDVVINEVFADETPKIGLPEAEFVELYNPTDFLIDLTGSRLYNAENKSSAFPAITLIQPKSYIIICSSSHLNDFKPFGNTLAIPNFPSLGNTGGQLFLTNAKGVAISKVNYINTWHADEVKKDGGWSLERVDPLNPCGTFNNWTSSVDPSGGTPGKKNSVYSSNPDQAAPKLVSAFGIAHDTLLVNFNEPIDSVSATRSIYSISNERHVQFIQVFEDHVALIISPAFIAKILYSISISNLSDCAGNYIDPKSTTSFFLAEPADSLDLIVNEVLFNPKVNGSDFVEIYNNSNKYINLKNCKLANLNDSGKVADLRSIIENDLIILPKAFKALTDNKSQVINFYPNHADSVFIEMHSMPSFNDDEGNVVLMNSKNKIIDLFHYKDDYHFKLIENKEGVSLERIDYNLPTNTTETWQSASSTIGYASPGFQNSQYLKVENMGQSFSIDPKVFTPDEDGWRDFTILSYNLPTAGHTANITIYDSQGREVKKLVQNHLLGTYGTYQWDGVDNNGHKASTGYYLIFVEIFDLKGNVNTFKESVVVGAKF
jgi:hypothetical protein